MSVPVHQRIIHLLEAEGINTLFGIPDPGFVHMALFAEQRGWQVVAPHHEQSGGFMADGWSRMTGKPGVVFGTQGPGIVNLAAAMIVAQKENSPTIFLGGNRSRVAYQKVKRGRIQYMIQTPFFAAAVKYFAVIEDANQTDEIIREAIRMATSGRPGPVYVELPSSVIHQTHEWGPLLPPENYRLVQQAASAPMLDKAIELIRQAKNPIMLVGQGAFTSRSHDAVAALARAIGCPILQTSGCVMLMADDLVDRTFAYGFSPAAIAATVDSDLCIAIGTELGEPVHFGLGRHWAKNNANRKWIYIERDPTAFGVNRSIDAPLVGDLRDIVPQLTEGLKDAGLTPSPSLPGWIEQQKIYKAEVLASVPSGSVPIHTARFIVEATKNLPKDTILVRDGGAVSIFGWTYSQYLPRDLVWNQNTGHLGTGLPYAVGAALAAEGKRPVVLITGDSSFMFHIAELETAVRKKLPIVTVIGCDFAWGLEVGCYRKTIGPNTAETEVHWGKWVRFDKIAEGFGAHGEFIEHEADIAPAVARALASGRPAVIQVLIDGDINAMESPNYEEFRSWYTDFAEGYGLAEKTD